MYILYAAWHMGSTVQGSVQLDREGSAVADLQLC